MSWKRERDGCGKKTQRSWHTLPLCQAIKKNTHARTRVARQRRGRGAMLWGWGEIQHNDDNDGGSVTRTGKAELPKDYRNLLGCTHLNLVDVEALVLLLELLDADLHGVHGRLGVLHRLDGVVGLLQVERLLHHLFPLVLVPKRTSQRCISVKAERFQRRVLLNPSRH